MAEDGHFAGFSLSVPLLFLVCGLCVSKFGIYEAEETQWSHQCDQGVKVPPTLPCPLHFHSVLHFILYMIPVLYSQASLLHLLSSKTHLFLTKIIWEWGTRQVSTHQKSPYMITKYSTGDVTHATLCPKIISMCPQSTAQWMSHCRDKTLH